MNKSDLKKAQLLKLFKVNKCVTLETICNYLNNSGRSTQRLLKSIGYYSSFTHNGKWYTLHDVPKFDIDGLWFYNGIGFSQLKDINSTIFHLIDKSEKGLTANDLSKLLSTSCPPILNRLYKKNKIDRVKAHGGFVYLSVKKAIRGQQVANIEKTECLKLPSKTDTISILVEFIRNPNCTLEELSSNLNQKGIFCDSSTIKNLFVHLSLEKKNSNDIENILINHVNSLFEKLPKELKSTFRLPTEVRHALTYAADHLKGTNRRFFMAETVCAIGSGGQRMAEKILRWNRGTIRKGMHELQSGIYCIDNFSGRGRKSIEKHLPNLFEDISTIAEPKSQVDPTFRTTQIYIPLTAKSVYERLQDDGKYSAEEMPTIRTISTKLNLLDYTLKKVAKTEPKKKIPQTDAIFEQVHKINNEADCTEGVLRLSMDAKATVYIGPFSRGGKSRQRKKASDHDFAPEDTLSLYGIYLPALGESYFNFTNSKATADFITDCLENLWPELLERFNLHTLVLNLDNGPENSGSRTQFIKRMVEFANKNFVTVRLAYYPPYHSKYNPVERIWGILENHWRGELLTTVEKTLGLARSMKRKGQSPVVKYIEGDYQGGIKLSKKEMAPYEEQIQRMPGLEKWFIDIPPLLN